MGVDHYENFPVASLLVPARLRPAIRAIYRFARTADDIADEGDASAEQRLAQLQLLSFQLDLIEQRQPSDWPDLAQTIEEHALPIRLLRDLLSAFAQDVTVKRYADFAQLLDYCRRSANPIGRLLLALYQREESELLAMSDAICTGLQLANFWQDIGIDWAKGRVYLPQDDLARFGVQEAQIDNSQSDARWQQLLRFEAERTRRLLNSGAPLARELGGRVGLELRLVVQGGLRILERIDHVNGDIFRARPRLAALDWILMSLRAAGALPTPQ